MRARFGTITQCLVEPTVPKCIHKTPKFIKNSYMNFSSVIDGVCCTLAEFVMNFGILCAHFNKQKCLADGRLFLPLKSAANTDTDC